MSHVGVTRNLGARTASADWVASLPHDADGAPELIAVQELPHAGVSLPEYDTIPEASAGHEPTNARRSALLVRRTLRWRASAANQLLALLGTYVAVAQVELAGRWVTVASIHAAPYVWTQPTPPGHELKPRSCEQGKLWHSDLAATALVLLAQTGPVLALGDFNECHGWDHPRHQGHHCGREFFARLSDGRLVDCTAAVWPSERRTGPEPDYQVDRVLADRQTANSVNVRMDPLTFDETSDHAAIWFSVG